jgi:3'-phosphoadenosine 5'-phosphosulfate (PAPS) 3'-phosphatase
MSTAHRPAWSDVLVEACERAARVARDMQHETVLACATKADRSALTAADLVSQCIIRASCAEVCEGRWVMEESKEVWTACDATLQEDVMERVRRAVGPDVGAAIATREAFEARVWGEEEGGREPVASSGTFILDPLDGTREWLSRDGGDWAVGCAFIPPRTQWPSWAVIVAPTLDALCVASHPTPDEVAWVPGVTMKLEHGAAWARSLGCEATPEPWQRVQREPCTATTVPHTILISASHAGPVLGDWFDTMRLRGHNIIPQPMGSMAKFVTVALGRAFGYVRMHNPDRPEKTWDHAAGVAICHGAGCSVWDAALDGEELTRMPCAPTWDALRGLYVHAPCADNDGVADA